MIKEILTILHLIITKWIGRKQEKYKMYNY